MLPGPGWLFTPCWTFFSASCAEFPLFLPSPLCYNCGDCAGGEVTKSSSRQEPQCLSPVHLPQHEHFHECLFYFKATSWEAPGSLLGSVVLPQGSQCPVPRVAGWWQGPLCPQGLDPITFLSLSCQKLSPLLSFFSHPEFLSVFRE